MTPLITSIYEPDFGLESSCYSIWMIPHFVTQIESLLFSRIQCLPDRKPLWSFIMP